MRTRDIVKRLVEYKEISWAYKEIEKRYKKRFAKRSGFPYMRHIDEGLIILLELGVTLSTLDAWCLHPLYQSDKELKRQLVWGTSAKRPWNASNLPEILAMEYRSVANAYLSNRKIDEIKDIKLSSLDAVNLMLIADKVQNYKDFLFIDMDTAADVARLTVYFNNWLYRLDGATSAGRFNYRKLWLKIERCKKEMRKTYGKKI